ncbi:MAG: crossover junction endodeoxyribonuclease RuvC [Candidatus Eisenbacteria bacterium]|nr:crossover junction endodeoxyribonuclease RuvC [Candidatus Eisenbacteria bacterium]
MSAKNLPASVERSSPAAGSGWAAIPDSGVILGVDPGSLKTGFGALRRRGLDVLWIHSGRLRPPRRAALIPRLGWLHDEFGELLDELRPVAVAVETSYVGRNMRAALTLGQARGVLIAAATRRKLPVLEFSPAEIKLSVVGHGTASKHQIQDMVPRLIDGLEHELNEDEADALAVALCCIQRRVREEWHDRPPSRNAP